MMVLFISIFFFKKIKNLLNIMLCTYKWNPTFPASATSGKNVNNYVLKYLLGSFSFYLQEAKKTNKLKSKES